MMIGTPIKVQTLCCCVIKLSHNCSCQLKIHIHLRHDVTLLDKWIMQCGANIIQQQTDVVDVVIPLNGNIVLSHI